MNNRDPRRQVGQWVHAKAAHVTSEAECRRRYGSLSTSKWLDGVVEAVVQEPTPTNHVSTFIIAKYYLDNRTTKRQRLNIRSVRSGKSQGQDLGQPPAINPNLLPASLQPPAQPPEPTIIQPHQHGNPEQATQHDVPAETGPHATNQQFAAICHGVTWRVDNTIAMSDIAGTPQPRQWRIKDAVGDYFVDGCDVNGSRSRLDYFLMVFPPEELTLIQRLTSDQLLAIGREGITQGELLRFFGILLLITRFEFTSRASLWSATAPSKYIPAPSFSNTGMPRKRFDVIFRCIRFSNQPAERPADMSSERFRWMLVDDFVQNINNHRAANFDPGDRICVDESMSRWYGLGGHWINAGLPMYVCIDRKPEAGCEIQNSACGQSGVMLQLKIVKTAEEEDQSTGEDEAGMLHGTKVLRQLVTPYLYSNRVVCADSYFASVGCLQELAAKGMKFIGVVKTATKKFPHQWLSVQELEARGDRRGLVSKIGNDKASTMLAYVWVDHERRHFIANTGGLMAGSNSVRNRWRQLDPTPNADPVRAESEVPQPLATEIYYETCGKIDQHNRHWQDTLMLEKKVEVKRWDARVNLSLLAMMFVDTWLVYSQCTNAQESNYTQKQFYTDLAEELIDNRVDSPGGHARQQGQAANSISPAVNRRTGQARAGVAAHLTPTKRKRTHKGQLTNVSHQGKCRVCKKMKTRHICSQCADEAESEPTAKTPWICHSQTGRMCFAWHVQEHHS